jgi:hypothetical protein
MANRKAEWVDYFSSDWCPLFGGVPDEAFDEISHSHHTLNLCWDVIDAGRRIWKTDGWGIEDENGRHGDAYCRHFSPDPSWPVNEDSRTYPVHRCVSARTIFLARSAIIQKALFRTADTKLFPLPGQSISMRGWNVEDFAAAQFIDRAQWGGGDTDLALLWVRTVCLSRTFGYFDERTSDDDITSILAIGEAWDILRDCLCFNVSKTSPKVFLRLDRARHEVDRITRCEDYERRRNEENRRAAKADNASKKGMARFENRRGIVEDIIKHKPHGTGKLFVSNVTKALAEQTEKFKKDPQLLVKNTKILECSDSPKQREAIEKWLRKYYPDRFLKQQQN